MVETGQPRERIQQAVTEQAQARLRELFGKMPHEIPLILFTRPGKNEAYSEAARQVIRAIREMAPKVSLREFDLGHDLAQTNGVTQAPTLLFDPGRFKIRWLGAPLGEEGQTFVEALFMMGYGLSGLSEQSLKILEKLDSPREIKLFVSPTCPYCPHQAVNALKAAVERPDLISLEIIDIQANPELTERYAAHGVPMAYANDQLIAQGAQPEELFISSLEKLEQQSVFIPDNDAEEVETDLVIVGGGPAGLTAGIYAVRSGLKAVIVERDALGGQVATTPVVENYPGLTQVGGKALVDIMVNHALQYANIFPGEEVVDIQPGEPIVVTTTRRRFKTKVVLLATGATYRHLEAPGEARLAGAGVSYCATCDGPLFVGKKVIIVGGGDSAATEALHLHHLGAKVTLVHRRDKLRAQARLAQSLAEAKIPVFFNSRVVEIKGSDRVTGVTLFNSRTKETMDLPAEGVFIAIGYQPAVDLARKIGVELTPDGYIKRDDRHRTNVPGIYSAGDVEGGYKQIVTAAGQGSEAALAIFEGLVNPYWKGRESPA